jgi:transaldolase/glucose-6-phosphate isomerase
MNNNPLLELEKLGQSIWVDYLRRDALDNGQLKQWIEQDGAGGLTSNPSIFEKAIAGSHDYDNAIRAAALEGKNIEEIYLALTMEDIQRAADLFRPTYNRLQGGDGFVSLEVSPKLAHDTAGTVIEARRLWAAVDRPNIFIKVPATKEGLPAIRQLIGEGINVNITLLFGLPRYREVAEAYLGGLETLASQGKRLDRVASVASFFLSRIDVLVDPMLEKLQQQEGEAIQEIAASLHGKVAIASAKAAYQIYKEIFSSERFMKLAQKGAKTQRLLWASTSTKNPEYSDVKYVDALIAPETINTVPIETLDAYRNHGRPALRIETDVQDAYDVLEGLDQVGINLDKVTQQLEDEGVLKFNKALDQLMVSLNEKREASVMEQIDRQSFYLGKFERALQTQLINLEKTKFGERLWRKDPSLWKSDPEEQELIRNSLGWLFVAEKMEENLREIEAFKSEVLEAGFEHVLVLGMGGSSLTPLVFERLFGWQKGALPLTVLDSTDPATIKHIEEGTSVKNTFFIISSKSGTTAEPVAFGDYFYDKVEKIKGDRAGENFCVITDPGTPLAQSAVERGYRKIFLNYADIGGRYSALSYFGLIPAALMGIDVNELLERSLRMLHACYSSVPIKENPGLRLGAALGGLAKAYKRYKVTFLLPEKLSALGMWLEQLLAESTGKEGDGLLPVANEPMMKPAEYDHNRLFVYIREIDGAERDLDANVEALIEAGQPVIKIFMDDLLDLGQEFFRWEIATATAGMILGINAFDQPNVQESKDNTNRLLAVAAAQGGLPEDGPSVTKMPLQLYFDETAPTVTETLNRFLAQAQPDDFVALMAYLEENPENQQALQHIRRLLQERLHIATTLGYGPRFLHSTGQFHKGGRNAGLFLQLTTDDAQDFLIPGKDYTFGTLKRAQALGDLEALRKHGRRAGRIHLGQDTGAGLKALAEALQSSLQPEEMKR